MNKKQFKYFTIMEYEKEEKYLQDMHCSGWKFVNVTGIGTYRFQKCEPEDVIYQLDYNQEGLKNKDEYIRMFNDCGWEYIQDFAGYSYFRKPVSEMNGEEAIFCDDESRFAMMQRVFKGRMLPLLIIFCCVLLPQFILNLCVYHNYIISVIDGVILGLYLGVFGVFAFKYNEFKNKIRK